MLTPPVIQDNVHLQDTLDVDAIYGIDTASTPIEQERISTVVATDKISVTAYSYDTRDKFTHFFRSLLDTQKTWNPNYSPLVSDVAACVGKPFSKQNKTYEEIVC